MRRIMTKPLAELPEKTVSELRELEGDALYTKIRTLRDNGWTLRSIAAPLNVSRTTVQNWTVKAQQALEEAPETVETPSEANEPTPSLFSYGSNVRPFKIPKDIPPKDIKVMQDLRERSKGKTRWTPENSDAAIASRELDKYISKYAQRKVPLQTIARHLGVTRRAVAQRIEKFEV